MLPSAGPPDLSDLRLKALQAVLLQLGFYAAGLGMVVVLVALPVAQMRYERRVGFDGIIAACTAAWLVWALIPPLGRRGAPGACLSRTDYPEIYRHVDDVADRMGASPPEEIYLLADSNASISAARHWWRKIHRLGLGLPLLRILTLGELRSVIAHELGHRQKGDLQLGPWVYGTRQAMARSVARMEQEGVGLHWFFNWYARLYLRFSQDVSRQQELSADKLASLACGRAELATALYKLETLGEAWQVFWEDACFPVLDQGLRPPLFGGFGLFLQQPWVSERLSQSGTEGRVTTGPYDSHPSLADRCLALGVKSAPRRPEDWTPAVDEFGIEVDSLEERLARYLAVGHRSFPVVRWAEVGERVWLPRWSSEVAPYERVLSSLGIRQVGEAMTDLDKWAPRLRPPGPALLSPEAGRRRAARLLAQWLCLLLARGGFRLEMMPGSPVSFERQGTSIQPFVTIGALYDGKKTINDWNNLCAELNV
jgi:Zn-dependent protease with chaperone function